MPSLPNATAAFAAFRQNIVALESVAVYSSTVGHVEGHKDAKLGHTKTCVIRVIFNSRAIVNHAPNASSRPRFPAFQEKDLTEYLSSGLSTKRFLPSATPSNESGELRAVSQPLQCVRFETGKNFKAAVGQARTNRHPPDHFHLVQTS